ncbi:MAG: catalase [Cyclobacteriaceae bacterium]
MKNNLFTGSEEKDIREMIDTMKEFLAKQYADGKILRNFHPKMHGCLKGTLKIKKNIPEYLKQGLFKTEKNYDAWIRFSNAPPKIQADTRSSGRGLAIKVLEVNGPGMEPDPIGIATQNFLLTTSPILSAWNIRMYKKAMYAVLFGFFEQLKFALHPGHWRSIFLTLKHSKKHENLLSQTYFSGGAFRFGPDLFVKFVLQPLQSDLGYTLEVPKSDNFLKEQLKKDMEKNSPGFILGVQIHEDESRQPLENTSIEWEAPFTPLAELFLPAQNFDFPERVSFGEELEFSPWIGLLDHEPVGGINRARKLVYKEMAAFRKGL